MKRSTKPIPQMSRKRKIEGKTYSELRKAFLLLHPRCQVQGCPAPSTEIQHKALRGRYYLRTDTWLAVCHFHGQKCTTDPTWAYTNGYRLTREQIRLLD